MSDNFNAHKEAIKIERMAAKLVDSMYPIERGDLQKKLQDEVNGLTPEQMRSVGLFIEKDTPRMDAMTGYFNDVTLDGDNNVTGFIFNRQARTVSVERKN